MEKPFDARDLMAGENLINEEECIRAYLANVLGFHQYKDVTIDGHGTMWIEEKALGSGIGVRLGKYKFVDRDTLRMPVLIFENRTMQQRYMNDGRAWPNSTECRCIPTITLHGQIGIIFEGKMATPELHTFLKTQMFTNWMDAEGYKVRQVSQPFFQSGAHDPDSGYFMLEFWSEKGIYDTCAFINREFKYAKPPLTSEELFNGTKH